MSASDIRAAATPAAPSPIVASPQATSPVESPVVPEAAQAAIRLTRQFTLFCFVALAVLAIGWEIWWAPLKPGGSMLAIKALPLLMALPFLARGSLKAYQWWSMLVMLYLCEGLVRVVSDPSLVGRWLGGIEAALSAMAFGAVVVYVRMASRARQISE